MDRSQLAASTAKPRRRLAGAFLRTAFLIGALLVASAVGASDADRYLEGYVTAVVEHELGVRVAEVVVEQGSVRIVLEDLNGALPERVAEMVARVEGVDHVEVRRLGEPELLASAGVEPEDEEEDEGGIDVLPRHELFDPLLADSRQPHFSAIYQWYLDDPELTHVGSANFGETFALLGGELGKARWEIGLLGSVFSVFDLDADSSDLVNSDFWVGPTLSVRRDGLSAQVRIYHQSSHLGDEYLLRNRTERVNLSYEGVDLLASAQLHPTLRVYAGGGVIVHSEPDLDPLSVQAGVELRSPVTFAGGAVRPIAAFDFQTRDENGWRDEFGAAGGIEIANPEASGMRLQILATWFKGNSPNGQFFERRIDSLGAGVHLHF